ncbi:MAG TPA: integrase arm-type DNA-binding domain-containing protein [Steroidobacteraceae bacterium]|jgi:integrase|nr:integrase arm-type DNA-binding domain-containing protein [Steroidobacteraceae bacterium]
MALSDKTVINAKAQPKRYRLFDGNGLYLEVSATSGKYWRMKYRFNGKEKCLAFGVYPTVSLKMARGRCGDAHRLLSEGIDPAEHKKLVRASRLTAAANSFEALALEWLTRQKPLWAESHWAKIEAMLKRDLFPWLGPRPITAITPPELLTVLRRIEARGAVDTTQRARIVFGQVLRYAVATGRAERDITPELRGAIAPTVKKHLAAITEPKEVGRLMAAISHYLGTPVVRAALRLAPLTFVRPGELRGARWSEIDLDGAEWRIPAERMKMREPHIVPLATQAVEILRELHSLTGQFDFVFPSHRSPRRPMSENAVLVALRALGYPRETMTGHGFRAMARTILDEVLNYRIDIIEHQLAHAVRDVNGRAYNRTAHLDARKKMMQGWADYLDQLKAQADGSNVVLLSKISAQSIPQVPSILSLGQ